VVGEKGDARALREQRQTDSFARGHGS